MVMFFGKIIILFLKSNKYVKPVHMCLAAGIHIDGFIDDSDKLVDDHNEGGCESLDDVSVDVSDK